jgi:aspartyl-tRNA(Asn)/glutamyl-tRNA(Gln) amidotransferase subunit A
MARTVRDVATLFQVMAENPSGYVPPPAAELKGVRIGLPQNFYFERLDVEVGAAVRMAVQTAAALGARIVDVRVPDMDALNIVGRVLQLAEAVSVFRPHLGRRADFGPDVLALLDQGRLIAAADYLDAQRLRRIFANEFEKLWTQVDCLFTPATSMPAPLISQTEVRLEVTRLVRGLNLLGVPALVIPCGSAKSGLPVGLQIIAAWNQEDKLLEIGAAMEDATAPPVRAG